MPQTWGPRTLNAQSASLITLPPLGNNTRCSSAFGHLNYSEQGKLRGFIHLSSKDKFRFRCPSHKNETSALSASKSGGWGVIQSLPPFHPPSNSPSHKSYDLFELTELLLIASYWPVTRWSMGKRQSLPIHILSGQQGVQAIHFWKSGQDLPPFRIPHYNHNIASWETLSISQMVC